MNNYKSLRLYFAIILIIALCMYIRHAILTNDPNMGRLLFLSLLPIGAILLVIYEKARQNKRKK